MEIGALPLVRIHPYLAAVHFHDRAAYGQTQAHPFGFGADKCGEQLLGDAWRHTATGVRYGDLDVTVLFGTA